MAYLRVRHSCFFFNNSFKREFLVNPELTPPLENSGWSPPGADTLFLLFLYWKPVKLSYLNHSDTKTKDTKEAFYTRNEAKSETVILFKR